MGKDRSTDSYHAQKVYYVFMHLKASNSEVNSQIGTESDLVQVCMPPGGYLQVWRRSDQNGRRNPLDSMTYINICLREIYYRTYDSEAICPNWHEFAHFRDFILIQITCKLYKDSIKSNLLC